MRRTRRTMMGGGGAGRRCSPSPWGSPPAAARATRAAPAPAAPRGEPGQGRHADGHLPGRADRARPGDRLGGHVVEHRAADLPDLPHLREQAGRGRHRSSCPTSPPRSRAPRTAASPPTARSYTFHLQAGRQVRAAGGPGGHGRRLQVQLRAHDDRAARAGDLLLRGHRRRRRSSWPARPRRSRGYKVVDDYTVEITLKAPEGSFLLAMTMPFTSVLPEEWVKQVGKQIKRKPLGTGPYVITDWTPGAVHHRREEPQLDGRRPASGSTA